jgi:hypothetical protein
VSGNGAVSFAITTTDAAGLELQSAEEANQEYHPELVVYPDRPSAPSPLVARIGKSSEVELHWEEAADDDRVAGYTIYRDGAVLTTVSSNTFSFSDFSIASFTTHRY